MALRSRGLAFAGCAALAGAFASTSGMAQEFQAESGKASPGTFSFGLSDSGHRGFSIVEPPDGVPSESRRDTSEEGSGSWFFRSWRSVSPADTAQSRYDEAMKALDAGRTTEAQRLFEQLVGDNPNGKLASKAREHLGRLYSGAAGVSANDQISTGSTRANALPWSGGQKAEARPVSLDVSQPLPRSVLNAGRVARAVDDAFLDQAGDRVFFGTGSAVLGTRAQGVIRAQARFLMQRPTLAAVIEGHADDGEMPDEETLRLSHARALAVRDRLVAEGVPPERIAAYGRAREERVSECPEADCMAQNRRAITILLDGPSRLSQRPQRPAGPRGAAPGGGTATQ